jgi:hypothetical protein
MAELLALRGSVGVGSVGGEGSSGGAGAAPPGPPSSNWFSAMNALRVYSIYLELDTDMNGMLSRQELARYGAVPGPRCGARRGGGVDCGVGSGRPLCDARCDAPTAARWGNPGHLSCPACALGSVGVRVLSVKCAAQVGERSQTPLWSACSRSAKPTVGKWYAA